MRQEEGTADGIARWNRVDFLVLLAIAVAAATIACTRAGTAVDDAGIVLRYARNLLHGHGWVYNPGEHVNGSTSALNTLLLAGLGWALGSLELAQPVVFGLCLAGVGWICHAAFRRRGHVAAALCAAIAMAQPLACGTIGLESLLMLVCACATALAFARRRMVVAGACLASLFLARGDGILLAVPLVAAEAVRSRSWRVCGANLARMLGTALALASPWLVFSTCVFGSPLPQTFAAKLAQTAGGSWPADFTFGARALDSLAYFDPRVLGVGAWPVLLLAVAGVAAAWRMRASDEFPLVLSAWGMLQASAYAALRLPAYHWYYVPLHFAVAISVSALAVAALGREHGFHRAPVRHLAGVALCASWLFVAFPDLGVPPGARYPDYQRTAAWLSSHTEADASVALLDIGVIGFGIGERRVVDMCSLIDPAGVQAIAAGRTDWWLDRYDPDYVVVHWPPRDSFEKPAIEREDFARRYERLETGLRTMQIFGRRGSMAAPR